MVVFFTINIFISIIFFCLGFFMQSFANNTVFFGVRIPVGYNKKEKLILEEKKYKKLWSILWVISFVISSLLLFNLGESYSVTVFLLFLFLQLILMQICYYKTFKRVKRIKEEEHWKELLTNKKVKYVDLKLNKEIKSSIKPIYYYLPWSIYLLSVIIPILKGKSLDILFIVISIVVLLIIQVVNLSVLKVKQDFNGGTLEALKNNHLGNKILLNKYLYTMQLLMAIFFSLYNLAYTSLISINTSIFIFASVFISIIILTLCSTLLYIKRKKLLEKITEESINEKGEVIVNRDDDDNYIMGMLYYNPSDSSLFVDKRMGFGTTFNFAHPVAKYINVFFVIMIVSLFIFTISIPMSNVESNFTESTFNISYNMYSNKINYNDIEEVKYLDEIPGIRMKSNGMSIGNLNIGYYKMLNGEDAKVYLINSKEPCIFIKLKNGKTIYLNYKTQDKTKEIYGELKTKLK